jgi:GH35 family endo-1,4-beta-xylanase
MDRRINKDNMIMNRTLFVFLMTVSLTAAVLAEPPMPTGPRLRRIVADNYPHNNLLIGATTGSWAFGTDQGVLMDREFSYVTPENDFKQSVVHPTPTEWYWSRADAWIQHIQDNDQVLRVHGPIGPQCSSWARDDARTPAELEENMREFFVALCQRYNGRPGFRYIDVVNETVIGGQWHTDKPGDSWECPWYKIGVENDSAGTPLYIRYAFEIAALYASDFRLVFNHHESPTREASWDLIKDTIRKLRAHALPVHGIGWQAHVDVGWDTAANLAALSDLISWAHTHNLEFHITEQSVWIPDTSGESLQAQSQTYRNIVENLMQHRHTGLVTWNTWHISDAHGWKKDKFPSLFDTLYRAKPAYYALQGLLATNTDLRCDFNLDGQVNWFDLGYLTSRWPQDVPVNEPSDLDTTGHIDAADYAVFSQQWQIPAVPLPTQAINPNPTDGATGISRTADLSWTPGFGAISHDVYFGTSSPPPFMGNKTTTTFDPGTMDYCTTYYWRIDEINTRGTTMGAAWSFITLMSPPPPPPP